MMALARDLGIDVNAKIHTDASATLGIVQRQGLGKLRHLSVQYLWIQERVQRGSFSMHKVPGRDNPADLMTKHVAAVDLERRAETLGVQFLHDRAERAPHLARVERQAPEDVENDFDEWIHIEGKIVRHHNKPRRALFTPLRVRGSPPARTLTSMRVTEGRCTSSGEKFRVVDQWAARSTAHSEMRASWVGTTMFWAKSK